MPDPNDPRYRGTGPPSLEQLRGLLLNATVESFRSPDGKTSEIRFKVDNQKLYDSGYSYYGTDSQIHAGFIEIVDRITEFEELTKRHADNITGVTCDDIIAQFRHEQAQINPKAGLLGAMQWAMFENAIKKMEELKEWRRAADQKRREKERAERERIKRERERMEKEAAKMREEQRRAREEAERQRGKNQKEDSSEFEKEFWGAFGEDSYEWARQYKQQWKEAFHKSQFGGTYSNRSGHTGQEKKQERPKARNKTRKPWFEVLGVQPTASKDEIKRAYRRLASKYHPDRYKEADANERMADINTARDEGLL